jgi:hypothetical protein
MEQRILDGSAWVAFCKALRRAGVVIERPLSPRTPLDRAEGYRYLSRLARPALENLAEWVRAEHHPQPATRVVKLRDLAGLRGGEGGA